MAKIGSLQKMTFLNIFTEEKLFLLIRKSLLSKNLEVCEKYPAYNFIYFFQVSYCLISFTHFFNFNHKKNLLQLLLIHRTYNIIDTLICKFLLIHNHTYNAIEYNKRIIVRRAIFFLQRCFYVVPD